MTGKTYIFPLSMPKGGEQGARVAEGTVAALMTGLEDLIRGAPDDANREGAITVILAAVATFAHIRLGPAVAAGMVERLHVALIKGAEEAPPAGGLH